MLNLLFSEVEMINDTNLLISTVSAVMRLEQMRAEVAANNIAMSNVPGASVDRFDAFAQFESLRAAVNDPSRLAGELAAMAGLEKSDYSRASNGSDHEFSLDAAVLEMSTASTRYQSLSEGVSRQFALMRLAIGGGR